MTRADREARVAKLSPALREAAVALVAQYWLDEPDLAEVLGISLATFQKRRTRLYAPLQVSRRRELMVFYAEFLAPSVFVAAE